MPRVSIVIPTFQREHMLREAVLSAASQVTDVSYEIVVVDNDPNGTNNLGLDEILHSALGRNIRLYRNNANLGMFGNWNRCVELAKGEWVTLLHDDDWLGEGFLSEVSPYLAGATGIVMCAVETGSRGYDPAYFPPVNGRSRVRRMCFEHLILGNVGAPGIVVKRDLLLQTGGFDRLWFPSSDYVTYIRIALKAGALRIERRCAYYRMVDSATFKGDTLQRMVRSAAMIRRQLIQMKPTFLGRLCYISSMVFWCRWAKIRASADIPFEPEWDDRLALVVSKSRVLATVLGAVRALLLSLLGRRLPMTG